jgi:Flp pilus assembly protein TadD
VKIWDTSLPTPEIVTRRRALALVEPLFAKLLSREDVLKSLRHNGALSELVRTQALMLARRYRANVDPLNNASWSVARLTHGGAAAYRLALRQAETACQLSPENGIFLRTLGVAQYRVGQNREAAATLLHADELNSVQLGESLPSNLAFLALAQHRLGQTEKAHATLNRLRESMKKTRWITNQQAQDCLREAEAVIVLDAVFPADPFAP